MKSILLFVRLGTTVAIVIVVVNMVLVLPVIVVVVLADIAASR